MFLLSIQFSSKVNSKVNRNRLRFKSSKKIVDGKASRGQWGADRYPSGKVRTCVQSSSCFDLCITCTVHILEFSSEISEKPKSIVGVMRGL